MDMKVDSKRNLSRVDNMKTLIVYDSAYGNTERIARAIGAGIGGDLEVLRCDQALGSMEGVELLVAGAPTYGGRPTPAMLELLEKIPASGLKDVKVAAFDTRLTSKFASIFGYAAGKIGASLESKGGRQLVPAEGFFVKGKKGPLAEGETERASKWGRAILDSSGSRS